ncbi:MAG: glycosyltransferase family 4 protein [Nitrospira sp.]|nr:glycosyltransferase family 4 protein [Nitrospira sp.]
MKKIRVLHACNQLGIGGTEKTIQVFSKYLDRSRFEVYACGLKSGGLRVQALEDLGVPVIVQPADLTALVRALKIDIYHVYRAGDSEPGTLPEKQQGWPRIVETNVFEAFDQVQDELIDAQIFMSEFSRDRYLSRNRPRANVRYDAIYNPVDFDECAGGPSRFGNTIGRCSRADDQKWHDVCVNSLPKIFRKVPGVNCVIQGATDRVKAQLATRGLLGQVKILEPSLDVDSFYRQVDVFIHGARVGETFGCVIAEAMSNGIPVVTLSTPQRGKSNAQAELVEHKVTGFVCRFQWQYAGAVIELLKNRELRETFGTRSREKAREQFEASRLTKKLEQVYGHVLDCSRG